MMAFNKGYELKKFEARWEKLRIEYAAAGIDGICHPEDVRL